MAYLVSSVPNLNTKLVEMQDVNVTLFDKMSLSLYRIMIEHALIYVNKIKIQTVKKKYSCRQTRYCQEWNPFCLYKLQDLHCSKI